MIYVENSSRHGNTRPPSLSPEKPVGRTRSNSCIPVVNLFWYLAKLIQFVKFKNKIKLKKKKKQQLELNTGQQAGSKLGKEYDKAVSCHPAYLTYIQST